MQVQFKELQMGGFWDLVNVCWIWGGCQAARRSECWPGSWGNRHHCKCLLEQWLDWEMHQCTQVSTRSLVQIWGFFPDSSAFILEILQTCPDNFEETARLYLQWATYNPLCQKIIALTKAFWLKTVSITHSESWSPCRFGKTQAKLHERPPIVQLGIILQKKGPLFTNAREGPLFAKGIQFDNAGSIDLGLWIVLLKGQTCWNLSSPQHLNMLRPRVLSIQSLYLNSL